jgi:hypothetical protein
MILSELIEHDRSLGAMVGERPSLFRELLADESVGELACAVALKVPRMPDAVVGADFTRPFVVAYALELLDGRNESLRSAIGAGFRALFEVVRGSGP